MVNPLDCVIRSARWEDLNQVILVEKQSFPPGEAYPSWVFINMLKLNPELFLVADCKGGVKGYVMGVVEGDSCHLISIAVAPDSRRLGLGRKLLRSFENTCRSGGLAKVVLEAKVSNVIAVNLYKSEGYMIEGLLANYYPNGSKAYRMIKRL